MEMFVLRENIRHLRSKLNVSEHEQEREIIRGLIRDETIKLKALQARSQKA